MGATFCFLILFCKQNNMFGIGNTVFETTGDCFILVTSEVNKQLYFNYILKTPVTTIHKTIRYLQ